MAHLKVSARELRGQLTILAVVLWATALVNAWTPTLYLRSGQVKGTDFVQFYALGRLAAEGRSDELLNPESMRRAQLEGVPESRNDFYPALYGPQVGVVLAPLGRLSYSVALVAWSLTAAVVYLLSISYLLRRSAALRQHAMVVLLAAVAYPPFWLLIQHGHLTVVATAVFVGAWAALRAGHPLTAGALLGLLAYKPPLLVPIAAVLVCAGAWRLLVGLAVGILVQFTPAWLAAGPGALYDYADLLSRLPAQASSLITRPEQLQGWRGFWVLLTGKTTLAVVLYGVSAVATVIMAAAAWRRHDVPSVRMSVLGLSVGLASPHLYTYDLVVLAPVWFWLTEWYVARPGASRAFGRALYLGYLAPLVGPLVAVTRIQFVAPLLLVLLLALWREGRAPAA